MADQKIEDTKSLAARRGARPFAGPAGAPTAARPFLKPAAPSSRAGSAPFAPPLAGKGTLGTPPASDRRVAETAPASALPAEPAKTTDNTPAETSASASAVTYAPAPPTVEIALGAQPSMADLPATAGMPATTSVADAAPAIETANVGSDEGPSVVGAGPGQADPPRRPVTSEMVALDAFDAFEAAWHESEPSRPSTVHPPAPAPLDDTSLGSGIDGPYQWAEEITGGATDAGVSDNAGVAANDVGVERRTPELALPAWLTEDVDAASTDTAESLMSGPSVAPDAPDAPDAPPVEPETRLGADVGAEELDVDWSDAPAIPSADDVMGAELEVIGSLGAPEVIEAALPDAATMPRTTAESARVLPDPLLAEYAPYIAMPDESAKIVSVEPHEVQGFDLFVEPVAALEDAPRPTAEPTVREALEAPAMSLEAVVAPPRPTDARTDAGMRASATLDRLAERLRGGEIQLSSLAPEATDAAVLASVLAALLGGSSSR